MEQIHLTAHFKIQPGKTEAFAELAAKCVEAVRQNEEGALLYRWFYNTDQTECKVLETYRNTEAVFAHLQNVGPLLQELSGISSVSGDIYGQISEPLRKGLEGLDISFYEYETGI